jgi:hypothetical protein
MLVKAVFLEIVTQQQLKIEEIAPTQDMPLKYLKFGVPLAGNHYCGNAWLGL